MTAIFKTPAGAERVAGLYRRALAAWPVPSTHPRLATRQGETFVVACGDPSAPPLILLHGAQSNAASWMFDAAVFSSRFRVYAIDLIGDAGRSAPSRPPLESEDHALWLDDVWAGLGVSRAAVVGLSLGGWLALDYAARRPGRVERLVLICPAGIGRQKNFLLRTAPLMLLGPWGMRKVREMVFGPAPAALPDVVRPLMDLMGVAIQPELLFESVNSFVTLLRREPVWRLGTDGGVIERLLATRAERVAVHLNERAAEILGDRATALQHPDLLVLLGIAEMGRQARWTSPRDEPEVLEPCYGTGTKHQG